MWYKLSVLFLNGWMDRYAIIIIIFPNILMEALLHIR